MVFIVLATFMRASSVAAFVMEVLTVGVLAGDQWEWASWRQFDLGHAFWAGLGDTSADLAFWCLIPCLILSIWRRVSGGQGDLNIRWCIWLNIFTIIVLHPFVPHPAIMGGYQKLSWPFGSY